MNPEEVMIKHIYSNLFANHAYGKNPKGEASEVVTMTYQELIGYYKSYYHPSNGQAFCFGKQDHINICLNELNNVLNKYDKDESIRENSNVEWQNMTKFGEETKSIHYPDYQEEIDYRSVIAFILNEQPMDLRTQVAWHLIYELLAGSNTALIPQVINEMDLGTDIVTHFQHSLQQWVIGLGVSGIASEEDVEKANGKIMRELRMLVSDGFDPDAMQAALHKMEFKFRDQSSDDIPLGVKYFGDILTHWNYDEDVMMMFHAPREFIALKTQIKDEGQSFLLELITQQMFDTKHAIVLSLQPDMNYALQYEKVSWRLSCSFLGETDSV